MEDKAEAKVEAAAVVTPRQRQRRLEQIYGPGFPVLEGLGALPEEKRAEAFTQWLKGRISDQESVMRDKRLHWARHRLFRHGRQWISTRDGREWREMPADENRVRAVFNHIGPALRFRRALLEEQRPGFKHTPIPGLGVRGRETALAQQSVVEWHFHTQRIWPLALDALSHAQTDGVAFLNVYISKDEGPLLEEVELVGPDDSRYELLSAQGYEERGGRLEVPLGASASSNPIAKRKAFKGGEIRTRLLLAHETWADPEARCIHGGDRAAKWFLVRRVRDLESARIQLDDPELEADVEQHSGDPLDFAGLLGKHQRQRGLPPFPSSRMRLPKGGVYQNLCYLAASTEFPEGYWVEVVGDRYQGGELPGARIPIARITDGSDDDELYPRPEMSDWLGDQISVNALGSKLMEYARHHAGSQLLALQGTQITETWTDIVGSMLEYKGAKPDVLQSGRANPDLWNLWSMMLRQLEDKTGWSPMARGQLTGEGGFQDIAGRAVLAARELFERQFGPMIRAAATGITDWSELVVVYSQYLYKKGRLIPMAGRADLAKRIDSDALSGPPSVYVEPETLQPLPRALRNQLLFDYLQSGLISVDEYKKRAPFAEIRDLNMGDSDQWSRAQMVNTLIEERWEELQDYGPLELYDADNGLGIYWQDDPEVHQKALEELILDDMQPFPLRKLAADRWGIYMELLETKSFPKELELQGLPRPPAPMEVLGVPNHIAQATTPSTQQQADGTGGMPPGGVPGAAPAPELGGTALPAATLDSAQPLGALGGVEAQNPAPIS